MVLPVDLFEEKVLAGNLLGVTGDLNASTNHSRYEKKCILIENGLCTEQYDKWATDDERSPDYDQKIQYKLVEHGYCLNILIHSRDRYVRRKVLEQDIRLALDADIMRRNDDCVREQLMRDVNPDLDVLRAYLKIIPTRDYLSLNTKLKAMEADVTTFETTMSPAQLYDLGHPTWARGLTVHGIRIVYDAIDGFHENNQPVDMEVILQALNIGLISKYTILKYCFDKLGVELWRY